MGTSTIRFAVIVAFVAGGILLIARFPQDATAAFSGATPTPPPSEQPTGGGQTNDGGGATTGGGQGTGDGQGAAGEGEASPTAQIEGVRLAVYNGTYETGLAGGAAEELRPLGYKIPETSVTDAEDKPVEQTALYYVARDDKIEAEALANDFFKDLDVTIQKVPDELPPPPGRTQVAVYLGTDYADALG